MVFHTYVVCWRSLIYIKVTDQEFNLEMFHVDFPYRGVFCYGCNLLFEMKYLILGYREIP